MYCHTHPNIAVSHELCTIHTYLSLPKIFIYFHSVINRSAPICIKPHFSTHITTFSLLNPRLTLPFISIFFPSAISAHKHSFFPLSFPLMSFNVHLHSFASLFSYNIIFQFLTIYISCWLTFHLSFSSHVWLTFH